MRPIPIALVDDESLFRKGMTMLINDYDEDFCVCMEASNGQEFLDKLDQATEKPKMVLLDLQMPVMNGIECTKQLNEKYPDLSIIILTTHYSKAFILNMLELGASSYLPKNSDPDEVHTTLREVLEKGFYYNDYVMNVIRENMANKFDKKSTKMTTSDLTKRETEVLQLICEQYTTSEIAEKLYLSPRTVDGHRNKLLEKSGAKNVVGLVVFAFENQIVKIKNKSNWQDTSKLWT